MPNSLQLIQSFQNIRNFRSLGCTLNSGCAAWSLCVITHYFQLYNLVLWTLWATFQAINTVRSALLALNFLKWCTEAIKHVPQIFTYVIVDKGVEHKGEQRQAMTLALEQLQLVKIYVLGWNNGEQWRNQACS